MCWSLGFSLCVKPLPYSLYLGGYRGRHRESSPVFLGPRRAPPLLRMNIANEVCDISKVRRSGPNRPHAEGGVILADRVTGRWTSQGAAMEVEREQ